MCGRLFVFLFLERYHNKPIISTHPDNTTVVVGTNVTFNCKTMSDLHALVQWTRNVDGAEIVVKVYCLVSVKFSLSRLYRWGWIKHFF